MMAPAAISTLSMSSTVVLTPVIFILDKKPAYDFQIRLSLMHQVVYKNLHVHLTTTRSSMVMALLLP